MPTKAQRQFPGATAYRDRPGPVRRRHHHRSGPRSGVQLTPEASMLTEDEKIVLERMGYDPEWAFCFAAFGLPRARARAACRSLRDKGLAEYFRGLWSDDGNPAGSGYAPTPAGVKMNKALDAFAWRPFCECRPYPKEPVLTDPRLALAESS